MSKVYYLELESGCDPAELLEFLALDAKAKEQPAALKRFKLIGHDEQFPAGALPPDGTCKHGVPPGKQCEDCTPGDFELRARAEMERLQWLKNHIGAGQMDILVQRVAKLAELAHELGAGRDTRKSRYDFEEDPALRPTERRLLELLQINDEKVYSAKEGEKAAKLDMQEQHRNWAWCIHKELEKDPRPDLPLPRLELQMKDVTCPTQQMKWGNIEWLYCLVYKAHWDAIVFVPLGMTLQRGGGYVAANEEPDPIPDGEGKWEPHREQFHMRTDMQTFGLEAFIVIEEKGLVVPVQPFRKRTP
jgi:hypothetical protein